MRRRFSEQVILPLPTFVWAWGAFVLGFAYHFFPFLYWPDRFVFGDLTDGYFNLWVMEHTRRFFASGNLAEYIHTRTFVPANHLVLFWSDSLAVPSLLYSGIYTLCRNIIISYNVTALLLIVAGFWIHYEFFRTLQRLVGFSDDSARDAPWMSAAASALLAYVVTFSDSRLAFSYHFQNRLADFVVLGATCALRFSAKPGWRPLGGALGVWVLLCYATPYYALALGLVLGVFAYLFVRAAGWRQSCTEFGRLMWIPAAAVLVALPMAAVYLAERNQYTSQREFSAAWWHLFSPIAEGPLGVALSRYGLKFASRGHEVLAYSGVFLAPVILLTGLSALVKPPGLQSNLPRVLSRAALVTTVGGLLWAAPNWPGPWAWAATLGATGLLAVALGWLSGRKTMPGVLMLAAAVLFYGTAFGPAAHHALRPHNPSLWGVLADFVPGYDSIRGVGRFGALGFSFALGGTWWWALAYLKTETRKLPLAALALGCMLSALFDPPRSPIVNGYDFTALTPSATESQFFAAHPARILILPANNLSLIPGHLIYFETLPTVELVNGYSGHFSSLVERLHVPDDGGTLNRIRKAIDEAAVTHLLLDRRAYTEEAMGRISAEFSAPRALDTPRFRLLQLPQRDAPPDQRPRIQGNPARAAEVLPRVHRVFGNLTTWLPGTHHGVGHQHLQAYLDEFTFRFNRRRTPMAAFQTLLGLGAQRRDRSTSTHLACATTSVPAGREFRAFW